MQVNRIGLNSKEPLKNYLARSGGVEFGLAPQKKLIYCVYTQRFCGGA